MSSCVMRLRLLPVLLLIAGLAAHADLLKIKTQQGRLQGKLLKDGKVRAFLGVPYAAPPVGDLRWRAPQPAAGWQGLRDATHFGSHCAQGKPYSDMNFLDGSGTGSEDCLFLNVFTPADAKPKSKLPVMFWIHGGSYSYGSASEPRHGGDVLPTKGVVLVTINYRLGVLGFLATTELAKEGNGAAGNYGLMDMVAALRWVRQNISSFGGDPQNVTIFGESAGSFAVSTLMASPMARGLFQKAIGESGGALSTGLLKTDSLEAREQHDDAWMKERGAATLAELRALPVEKLLTDANAPRADRFHPVVDGRFLTEPISETYAENRQAHVPLLAGWNRDEHAGAAIMPEEWQAKAKQLFPDHTEEFLSFYPGRTAAEATRSEIDYDSAMFISLGTWRWIEAHRQTGDSPIWRYQFDLAAPPSTFHPGSYAFHSDEIEYVFGVLDTRPGAVWREEDRRLSEQMMRYWTNFAKRGDPNGPGLPEWPRYDATGSVMHLDAVSAAAQDTTRARFEFLAKRY